MASQEAKASQTQRVIKIVEQAPVVPIPDLPADCKVQESSGVTNQTRIDIAWLQAEAAIQRGNERIERCANLHEKVRMK